MWPTILFSQAKISTTKLFDKPTPLLGALAKTKRKWFLHRHIVENYMVGGFTAARDVPALCKLLAKSRDKLERAWSKGGAADDEMKTSVKKLIEAAEDAKLRQFVISSTRGRNRHCHIPSNFRPARSVTMNEPLADLQSIWCDIPFESWMTSMSLTYKHTPKETCGTPLPTIGTHVCGEQSDCLVQTRYDPLGQRAWHVVPCAAVAGLGHPSVKLPAKQHVWPEQSALVAHDSKIPLHAEGEATHSPPASSDKHMTGAALFDAQPFGGSV